MANLLFLVNSKAGSRQQAAGSRQQAAYSRQQTGWGAARVMGPGRGQGRCCGKGTGKRLE